MAYAPPDGNRLRRLSYVFIPQTLSIRPGAPLVYKVTLLLTAGISTLFDTYGVFLGRHIALGQQRAAILHGLINIFMLFTDLNMLT